MNPHLCRVVLRPRGPLEVFDLGFRLVRERWSALWRLTALTVGPLAVVCTVLCWVFDGHWALLLVPLVAGPAIQAPFTMLTGRMLFSDEVSLAGMWSDLRSRARPLAGAWALAAVGWIVGAAACWIGVIPAQAVLLYLTEAAILERVGLSRGLRRSTRLAGSHLGIALVGAAARWGLALWLGLLGEATGQAVVGFVLQLGEPFGSLSAGLVTPYLLIGLLLAQPAHAIYRLLLYVDVRTRVEGWDLQVGLRAAGLSR